MTERNSSPSQTHSGLGRIVLKNTLAITLGDFVLKAINVLFSVYVVRSLGDDRFGQYSIVLGFVGLFQIFAELGISQYVMREIARDRNQASSLFWNLVALRFLLAISGMGGITLGAIAYGYSPELVLGVLIFTSTFLFAAFSAPLEVLLTANERLDYVTAGTIAGQLTFTCLGAIFLFSGLGFIWLFVAGVLGMLPRIGLALWAVQKHHFLPWPLKFSPRSWLSLLRAGLPFGIISLTLSIAFSIDTVMMSRLLPEYMVGWYSVAYGLVFSFVHLFNGFRTAIVPSLTRAFATDSVAVQTWYYRSVKYGWLLSLPIAIGGTIIAAPLMRFLYTDEFSPAALGLQILIWDVPLLMFTNLCGNMTTIISEERAAARIYTINALANVVLNLYAIPKFGLVGAALVTVTTDLIGALQFHFLLRQKLKLPDMTWTLVRMVVAAVLMGCVIYWVGDLHPLLLIGLGGLVYAGLVLAFRLIDQSERALILRLLHRFSPRMIENA